MNSICLLIIVTNVRYFYSIIILISNSDIIVKRCNQTILTITFRRFMIPNRKVRACRQTLTLTYFMKTCRKVS